MKIEMNCEEFHVDDRLYEIMKLTFLLEEELHVVLDKKRIKQEEISDEHVDNSWNNRRPVAVCRNCSC